MLLTIRGDDDEKRNFYHTMLGLIFHEIFRFFSSFCFSLFNNDLQVELIIFGNFRPFHEQLFVGSIPHWTERRKNGVKSKIKNYI
jgi:hypothetical protein